MLQTIYNALLKVILAVAVGCVSLVLF